MLNLQYVGALPAATFSSAAAGYDGVVALDVVGFNVPLDQATIAGGRTFLGGGLSAQNAIYNAASLGAGANSTYRLGGGAGILWLNTPVLTGANAVQFGAISNVVQAQSISPALGGGTIFLNTANDYSGGTTFNVGQNIEIGNAGALGSGTLIFNGGALNPNGNIGLNRLSRPLTVTNALRFLGDATINANGADFILSGNVALTSDAYGTGQGAARTITAASTTARAVLSGVISDSGGGTASFGHLIKAGAGVLELRGANTYTGFTQVNAGTLVVGAADALPSASHVMLNGGTLAFWDSNYTFGSDLTSLAASNFAVGAGLTVTQSGASNMAGVSLTKTGEGALVLAGNNSFGGLNVASGRVEVSADAHLGDTTADRSPSRRAPRRPIPDRCSGSRKASRRREASPQAIPISADSRSTLARPWCSPRPRLPAPARRRSANPATGRCS
ncbi:outer membrane protein IcsA autotransporter [Opitutia bacterium]|nr:outer membrane protein IcsA autotransporter [Opitutae bacterium]